MKKLISLSILMLLIMTACSNNNSKITIGILQPIEHSSLAEAREGFIDGLAEAGYDDSEVSFNYQNALGSDTDLKTYASDLVRTSDMVLGIGTGAAQALQTAAGNINSDLPIMFTAVTDPVGAGLVESMERVGGNICGTTDMNPIEQQIDLIKTVIKDVETVGIIYNASEQNSEVQANLAKVAIEDRGLQCEIMTVSQASDIALTVRDLCSRVQAIYIPTDNLLAANMSLVGQVVNEEKVLVVTGAGSMVTDGGHITLALDYYELGKLTGQMAEKILSKEENISDMSVGSLKVDDCVLTINYDNLAIIGIELPDSLKNKE